MSLLNRHPGRVRAILTLLMAVGAGLLLTDGLWLKAKAHLSQVLIRHAWQKTLVSDQPVRPWPWADTWPVARLSVPDGDVDLVVLAGAHGRSMPFGPGHLASSSAPGSPGNCVLAGHRDTHFQFLKNLSVGDTLLLGTPGQEATYRVTEAMVLDEKDTWVTMDTGENRLTLITCWPFDALIPGGPGRYVVVAQKIA